ncbi:Signal recognition particle receptor FtsY [Buchnera aphidicola (Thelaxes suberi)]|uniref:signal recognition particle-docking protein FtsY n=1 Tax=Buchnera aphidicola TaxID=9 RepID=UPI003464B2E2
MSKEKKFSFFSFFNLKKEKEKKKDNTQKNKIIQSKKTNENNKIIESNTNIEKNIICKKENIHSSNSFFQRLSNKFQKTKEKFTTNIKNLFLKKEIDKTIFKKIEEQLIMADLGVKTTSKIINQLINNANNKQIENPDEVYILLKKIMLSIIKTVEQPLVITENEPFFILVVGVNGVGKTTTIGKLSEKFKKQGKTIVLAAGDTFRAAGINQLLFWSKKNNIPLVKHLPHSDPASVIFDALHSAKSKKSDIVIADTAGRLQNKINLMEEIKKIIRVSKKINPTFPNEIILVIDACSGQNAIDQVKIFNENLGITGLIITKLDGTAKGGVIFSIAEKYSIPIRYIGIGETTEDLDVFNAKKFIEALF